MKRNIGLLGSHGNGSYINNFLDSLLLLYGGVYDPEATTTRNFNF